MVYHIPALLYESIEGLNIQPEGIYVDVTFGGGGHSAEILKRLKNGKLIAFDQDEDARMNVPDDEKIILRSLNNKYKDIELTDQYDLNDSISVKGIFVGTIKCPLTSSNEI